MITTMHANNLCRECHSEIKDSDRTEFCSYEHKRRWESAEHRRITALKVEKTEEEISKEQQDDIERQAEIDRRVTQEIRIETPEYYKERYGFFGYGDGEEGTARKSIEKVFNTMIERKIPIPEAKNITYWGKKKTFDGDEIKPFNAWLQEKRDALVEDDM